MKKICALIMLVMLGLPGAAQAYYFEVELLEDSGPVNFELAHHASVATSGNLAQYMLSDVSSASGETGRLLATLTVYTDAGPGVFTDVNLTLMDTISGDAFLSSTLQTTVSTSIYELVGETKYPKLEYSNIYDGTPSSDFVTSVNVQQPYPLQLKTGVTYMVAMDYANMFMEGDGGIFADRTLSLSVCCDDCNSTPIPGAVWLLGTGLAGLVGLRRKLG